MEPTKAIIEAEGTATGRKGYGVAKCFEWKEYKYKGRFYWVSQFDDDVNMIGGYSDLTGNYSKKVNY